MFVHSGDISRLDYLDGNGHSIRFNSINRHLLLNTHILIALRTYGTTKYPMSVINFGLNINYNSLIARPFTTKIQSWSVGFLDTKCE